MRKKDREELILKRANELALSGECQDWMSIEIKLRHEGFWEARQLLDDRVLRNELNETCKAAREKTKPANKSD